MPAVESVSCVGRDAVHQFNMARKSRTVEMIGQHLTFAELKAKFDYAAARGDVDMAAKCYRLLASCADGQERYRSDTMHRLWGLR